MQRFFTAGQYSFPFSFILGPGLPSSFSHNWSEEGRGCFAKVEYRLVAGIDSNLANIPSIHFDQMFIVNSGLKGFSQT
jgi:Arrestin (or S-antigen), N-terminal domain